MEKLENIIKEICKAQHVALYDMEIKPTSKGKVLVIYITKVGGITVSDCQSISRKISNVLDEEDLITGRYFLEVSSPGLERKLTQKKHYKSAINEMVLITYQEEDKTIFKKGKLIEVQPEFLIIKQKDESIKIDFRSIKKAKTVFDDKRKEKK